MTNPQIPDRTFVDDLGRRWEWCGGEPGTWAWHVTDEGQRMAITRVQASVLAAFNTMGATLLGPSFTPLESSLIPDADVAAMLAEIAEAMPPCPRCGQPIKPGQWIVSDGTHVHCPELRITDRGEAVVESGLSLRQAHEIETGCTPDQLCDRCRKDIGDMPTTQEGGQ